jgi:hypothetical protein
MDFRASARRTMEKGVATTWSVEKLEPLLEDVEPDIGSTKPLLHLSSPEGERPVHNVPVNICPD